MICEKCGKPLKEGEVFCSYCGHFVPSEKLDEKTKTDYETRSKAPDDTAKKAVLSIRMLGMALMAIGIGSDLLGMLMVSSGSIGSFTAVLFIGSVSFLLGLVLTFGGRFIG